MLKDTTSRSCATATAQGGYMILVQLEVKGIKQHNHTAHGTAEARAWSFINQLDLVTDLSVSPINLPRPRNWLLNEYQ